MTGGIFNGAADEGIFGLGDDPVKDTSGAGPSPIYTTTPGGMVGGDVRTAQLNLQRAGFDVGPTGVDGVWGPCTAAALRDYISAQGQQAAVHVFGTTLVARARSTTGACARTARTPGTTTPGTTVPGTTPPAPPPGEQQASIFRVPEGLNIPGAGLLTEWWFWLAVAGVAGLGYMGIRYYQKKKEEKETDESEVSGYGAWA
jgi:peptidoglycan hydrolase-like protein with peptidoglycan-binding domain